MDFPSSNEQLKCLVHDEFPTFIPVPSLADSSMFNILHFCSLNEPYKKSWTAALKKTFWKADDSKANFCSLGWLFDYIEEKPEEKVKKREVPVCIHGQASGSEVLSADVGAGMGLVSPYAGCSGSASFENTSKKHLDLGEIKKSSVTHQEVQYWLKRFNVENSSDLIKEAKKRHLYIIYAVLLAEHLKIEEHQSTDILLAGNAEMKGNTSGMAKNDINVKGSGGWKRGKGFRLSRTKKMGRYPIAFKVGRVRYNKHKRHLDLVGLKEFYQPHQFRCQNQSNGSDQSRKYMK